jgi:hypothetical protein
MQQELDAIYDIVESCLNSIDYDITVVDYRAPIIYRGVPEPDECGVEDIEESVLLEELQEYGKDLVNLFIKDKHSFWIHIDGECVEVTPILKYSFDTDILHVKIYTDTIDQEVVYNWVCERYASIDDYTDDRYDEDYY